MIKIFKNLNKKDYLCILIITILIAIQIYLDLKLPDYMSNITSLIQKESAELIDILKEGSYMLLCALGSLISAIVVGFFTTLLSADFSLNIRSKIFQKVQSFSMNEIKKFSTNSLITRTTNDVTQIEMFLAMGLQLLIKSPIMAVCAIIKILGKSQELSLLTGICVLILLITVTSLILIVFPRFKIVQKLIDSINGVTRENLTGIRVIRAFNAEKFEQNRFEQINSNLTNTQMFNQRCFALLNPVMNLIMHGQTIGVSILGAFLIQKAGMLDKITLFSNMVVFTSYGMQVIMSFLMLAMIFMILPRAGVSAGRINEILDEKLSIKDGTFDGTTDEKGTVEFKNVSFKYPDADEYILKNISFKAKRGETIAFIGSTGSGKSTLVNLILRFYDVTEGKILVDGIDVKEYKQEALNNKIGYIPQKSVMFTGSVSENISYGSNGQEKPTEDKIKTAIEIAQGKEFVEAMDKKYDSHIARGGANVSGGQKQRLSIARAIARNPEIFIFDDSFSALDYKTDVTLRKNLKKHITDATNIIVAQRIGTIIHADKIVVLEKGECVGIGTHKELLEKCESYKEIAKSQLSEEELNHA